MELKQCKRAALSEQRSAERFIEEKLGKTRILCQLSFSLPTVNVTLTMQCLGSCILMCVRTSASNGGHILLPFRLNFFNETACCHRIWSNGVIKMTFDCA